MKTHDQPRRLSHQQEQTTMPKPKLTPEIKLQADAIVARFNVEQLQG
jgi:hypothetical protein